MAFAASVVPATKPSLDMTLRVKLSVMMFLQFATWGAWFAILAGYLQTLAEKNPGFNRAINGQIIGTMALATIFAPLFVGQIADRFFSSEKLMAILHVAGAGLLWLMGQLETPGTFYWVALLYALLYSPTLALSNSIAFTHIPDAGRDFPNWVVAGLLEIKNDAQQPIMPNAPFLVAAWCSFALGIFSLMLPKTPPPGKAGDAFPFVKALSLFKDLSFSVFFGVSFVITIVLAFYYTSASDYLEFGVQLEKADVARLLTVGQFAEMLLLPLLPIFIKRFGMKWVLALGMLSWGIRYAFFSLYSEVGSVSLYPLVIVGIALHGICFDFFFAAGFILVDNKSPIDIRGSSQALFTFLTYGVGMWIGNVLAGQLGHRLTDQTTKEVNWAEFWLIPSIGVLICFAVFVLFFRENGKVTHQAPVPLDP
jgi:nucleoside transporter